ncbi:MAG: ribosome small subunit-dependent GTPase A, partial [Myxococcaceae bacterium]
ATVLESGAQPVLVLTKADLVASADTAIAEVRTIAPKLTIHAVSVRTGEGLDALDAELRPGITVALIGSSGVGKSTLINRWLGTEELTVGEVDDLGHGRHTTTHRHLVKIPSGALLIDTPGMREMGLWDSGEGVDAAFADIEELSQRCRFNDCAHEDEPGCAVRAAVDRGELDADRQASFHKLKAEVRAKSDAQVLAERKGGDKSATRARKKRR